MNELGCVVWKGEIGQAAACDGTLSIRSIRYVRRAKQDHDKLSPIERSRRNIEFAHHLARKGEEAT
jgi:hypothetical protein